MKGHDILLWENPPGGRNMRGELLPAGWVWTCECKTSGTGFPTETDAYEASEFHLLPYRPAVID